MLEFFFIVSSALIVFAVIFYLVRHIIVLPQQDQEITKCIEEKRYEDAEFLIQLFLKNDHKNMKLQYMLTNVYWLANQRSLAMPILESFVEHEYAGLSLHQKKQSMYRLAEIYRTLGNVIGAFQLAEELLIIDGEEALYHLLMAKILIKQKNPIQALVYLEKCLKLDKKNEEALTLISTHLFALERYKEAYNAYMNLSLINPDSSFVWYQLGQITEILGEPAKALKYYGKTALLSDPKLTVRALYHAGNIYLSQGDHKKALNEFEKGSAHIKELNTTTLSTEMILDLYDKLGDLYMEINLVSEALQTWDKVIAIDKSYKNVAAKIAEHSVTQINDFFKDILTNKDEKLLDILYNFTKNLGYTVDSYDVITPEFIIIIVYDIAAKWRDQRRRKFLFAFWCVNDPVPNDIPLQIFNKSHAANTAKSVLITAGPILTESRQILERKSTEIYDITNLQDLTDEKHKQAAL